jgi:hypothetical protein
MTIDRKGFKETLIQRCGADDAAAETILAKAEPFFIRADAGVYRFAVADEVRKSDVAQAVRTVLDCPVKKVELISVSRPWDDWPPYFNDGVIKDSLRLFLQDGLMESLPRKVMNIHYRQLQQQLGPSPVSAYQLEAIIKDVLQKALWKSLKKSMEGGLWPDDLWRELYRCINTTLTCYCGYVLAGMTDRAEEVGLLMDVLPSTIPAAAMKFSRSTRISFVA